MLSIAHPNPKLNEIPVLVHHRCLADCDLPDMILCWLRRERELRADLAVAPGSDDAEVLARDLAAAERRIDMLIDIGRWAA
jgi:hypothetical protein